MITIIIISILYAAIRAKHDSYLREGKWKFWAFIEGVFMAGMIAFQSYAVHGLGYKLGMSMLVFGIIFWIVFDIFTGIIFGKHPLYIGNTGFDKKVREIFCYTERWKGTNYLIFKLVWLTITIKFYTL